MAIFQPGARRKATIIGHRKGLISAFLVEELTQLVVDYPTVGNKLVRLLGKAAVSKEIEQVSHVISCDGDAEGTPACLACATWRSDVVSALAPSVWAGQADVTYPHACFLPILVHLLDGQAAVR